MENKKKALGKGLEQLFSSNAIDFNELEKEIVKNDQDLVEEIKVGEIRNNPYQPRKTFSEESLQELAESIKEYGVVQPIILKKSIKGYELIAGERRLRASKIAGLETIPAIIKDFTDQEMMEIALLENIQREDLNSIEVAESINSIITIKNLTQEEFAKKLGKSRSYVTNMLGLLKLPIVVKDMVRYGNLSMSHAKILSKLDDEDKVIKLAKTVLEKELSVQELNNLLNDNSKPSRVKKESSFRDYEIYERLMNDVLEQKAIITKNKIEIKFSSEDELIQILERMNIKADDL